MAGAQGALGVVSGTSEDSLENSWTNHDFTVSAVGGH